MDITSKPRQPGNPRGNPKVPPPEEKSTLKTLIRKRGWLGLLLLLLLLIPTLIWALSTDRRLRKVQQMQEQMFSEEDRAARENLSREEREAQFRDYMKLRESLTPAQQKELNRPRQEKETARLRQFAQMSRDEKNAYMAAQLQKEKDAMEKWKQRAQGQGAQGGNNGQGGGKQRGGNGNNANGNNANGNNPNANGNNPNGNNANANNPNGDPNQQNSGPGGRGGQDPGTRAKVHLDFTTPEERGLKYMERTETNNYRASQGLPPSSGRGGPPGGWGGGPPGGGRPPRPPG